MTHHHTPQSTEMDPPPPSQEKRQTQFWRDIIYRDGKIDEGQVMKELLDFSDMMNRFTVFLDEATGGRMSKLNYTTGAMLGCLNSHIEDITQEAVAEASEELEEQNALLRKEHGELRRALDRDVARLSALASATGKNGIVLWSQESHDVIDRIPSRS